MRAFDLADMPNVYSILGGEVSLPGAPFLDQIFALAQFKDICAFDGLLSGATHGLQHATGNDCSNELLPEVLRRWLDLPLRLQRENLRVYMHEGHLEGSEKLLDRAHTCLSTLRPGGDPVAALFRCGIDVNLGFLRAEWAADEADGPASSWRVLDLLKAIELAHATVALTLSECGKHLRICPDHLGRLFKGITGIAFRPFLRKYRVARVAELLNETVWTLAEIASVIGHSQNSHLVREFRDEIGVTPGQFRRLRQTLPRATSCGIR